VIELTGKQKRHLRSLGHHLEPALMIGTNGVGEGAVGELERALGAHELVKVRIGQGCGASRKEVAAALAHATGCAVAQILGKTLLFYRPARKPRIQLP
jgi:RNA-binding protein